GRSGLGRRRAWHRRCSFTPRRIAPHLALRFPSGANRAARGGRLAMKSPLVLTLTLVLALGLAGCGKKSASVTSPGGSSGSSGTAMDRAEAAAVVSQVPEVVEDGAFETADEMSF